MIHCPFACILAFVLPGSVAEPAACAQQPLADAAEISHELLYHPALRIEPGEQEVVFRAARFTYRYTPASDTWQVARERNFDCDGPSSPVNGYTSERLNLAFQFTASANQNEAVLEIRRATDVAGAEPLARLTLWQRKQLAAAWIQFLRQDTPGLSPVDLEKDLEVAEPEVAGVTQGGGYLWLAIRYAAGEGSLGIGTIVRIAPGSGEAKAFQPVELATSSITHIVFAGEGLWLGTRRLGEGTMYPTKGLVRLDPTTGEVHNFLPESSPIVGRIVTALTATGDALWVGTDAGICRARLPAANFTCWGIVPTIRLEGQARVSNRPGGPSISRLAAGSYEVRWANAAFLEVVTAQAIEGWLAADDLDDYARNSFETDAYQLRNFSGGGAAVMRLLDNPEGDPLAAAQVYRAPLERIGAPTVEGWQRVRVRVGWIARGQLEIIPQLERVSR